MTKKPDSPTFPYKTGDEGYNRRSGKKTLVFVGICITLVTLFSILALVSLVTH